MYSIEVKGINSPVVYTRLCIDIIQINKFEHLNSKYLQTVALLNTGNLKCQ